MACAKALGCGRPWYSPETAESSLWLHRVYAGPWRVVEKVGRVQNRKRTWVPSLPCQWDCILFYRIKAALLSGSRLQYHLPRWTISMFHCQPPTWISFPTSARVHTVFLHLNCMLFLSQNSPFHMDFLPEATSAPGSTLTNLKQFKAEKNLWADLPSPSPSFYWENWGPERSSNVCPFPQSVRSRSKMELNFSDFEWEQFCSNYLHSLFGD